MAGGVAVEIDRVMKPGSLVSGTVTFTDGVSASWAIDQFGRLAIGASRKGYKPTRKTCKPSRQSCAAPWNRGGSRTRIRRTGVVTGFPLLLCLAASLIRLSADHFALDLVGAFVDLRDLGVAHHLLDRIFLHVAVAAEDLHGVGGHASWPRPRRTACTWRKSC